MSTLSLTPVMGLSGLDHYPACDPDQAISCRVVYDWTGNDTAATLAEWALGRPFMIVVIIGLTLLGRWAGNRVIDRVVSRAESGMIPGDFIGAGPRRLQRARTMGSLFKSVLTGLLMAVAFTMILSELGINIGPLISSAGIVGVALGFGAQALVKDFLAGVFMILEDQYGVGDVVNAGDVTGTVEAVSFRVTRLRDVDGTVWYVRNGEILRLGNMSQNWARTVLDISVGYAEDLTKVTDILREVSHELWLDEDYQGIVIEEPEVWGVENLSPDGVTVRVTLKTAPMEQWRVAREMRQRIKSRFDHEGIEIPFPQRVVWHRNGNSSPDVDPGS